MKNEAKLQAAPVAPVKTLQAIRPHPMILFRDVVSASRPSGNARNRVDDGEGRRDEPS